MTRVRDFHDGETPDPPPEIGHRTPGDDGAPRSAHEQHGARNAREILGHVGAGHGRESFAVEFGYVPSRAGGADPVQHDVAPDLGANVLGFGQKAKAGDRLLGARVDGVGKSRELLQKALAFFPPADARVHEHETRERYGRLGRDTGRDETPQGVTDESRTLRREAPEHFAHVGRIVLDRVTAGRVVTLAVTPQVESDYANVLVEPRSEEIPPARVCRAPVEEKDESRPPTSPLQGAKADAAIDEKKALPGLAHAAFLSQLPTPRNPPLVWPPRAP